jgi:phosphoesterase RecJ-like protein
MLDWRRFIAVVQEHRRFVLTTHVRPDGDALGSEVAMAEILAALGKEVLVCNAFTVPPNLRFLAEGAELKQLGADVSAAVLDRYEVLLVLDTAAWAQLGEMGTVLRNWRGKKVVLDHHVSGDDLGAEVFKDVAAEATGALVVEAARRLGVPLTASMARAAFVAVATDTGWFRFASTRAETFRLAAELVAAGAVPDQLYRDLYETESLARLRLIGRALEHAQIELGGRLIHTFLDADDFSATTALSSDSEDIINLTLSVGGTEFAVIFVEQPEGTVKVSLRSRCALDCAVLAERFGGGGHRKAAGIMMAPPLDHAKQLVLAAVREALQQLGPPPAVKPDG